MTAPAILYLRESALLRSPATDLFPLAEKEHMCYSDPGLHYYVQQLLARSALFDCFHPLQLRNLVDAHAPPDKSIGISFDEWNVWYAWYRPVGVAEGSYTASMLHHFCRDARGLGITLGAFFEPVNEGAIWVNPEGTGLTAMGRVFRLLKAHQSRQVIALEGMDPGSDIDVVASLDGSAGDVLVSLVNRSPDQSHEVELSFLKQGAVRQWEGSMLSSPDFLPASVFAETQLNAHAGNGSGVSIMIPPHSVALVRATF